MKNNRMLNEAMRNRLLAGLNPVNTMENIPFRDESVSADFTISGHHRPASMETPEENPEVEIVSVRDSAGNDITGSISDDEFEMLTIYIENNRQEEGPEPDFSDY